VEILEQQVFDLHPDGIRHGTTAHKSSSSTLYSVPHWRKDKVLDGYLLVSRIRGLETALLGSDLLAPFTTGRQALPSNVHPALGPHLNYVPARLNHPATQALRDWRMLMQAKKTPSTTWPWLAHSSALQSSTSSTPSPRHRATPLPPGAMSTSAPQSPSAPPLLQTLAPSTKPTLSAQPVPTLPRVPKASTAPPVPPVASPISSASANSAAFAAPPAPPTSLFRLSHSP
jgi:hypothetical protein